MFTKEELELLLDLSQTAYYEVGDFSRYEDVVYKLRKLIQDIEEPRTR